MEALRRKIEKKTNRDVLRVYRYTRSAVLLPLIRRQGEWRVLFEVRSESLKAQPGEICFPGGWVEAGEDECETAVRETCEELRVPRSSIEVWGDLGILVTPFQQILYPFVGVLLRPELVDPNPLEVAEVFSLSLDDLLAATPSYYEIPVC
ncbi:MAG: CoA pyrophosphatase, partial [Clostridia bacterium]|nr:CoA pyrophosphatase [Clostridia bacterium]